MKLTDQPDAKLKLWAANPRAVRTPRIANLPPFGVRRFDSYAALNAWKDEYVRELIRRGGATWTN